MAVILCPLQSAARRWGEAIAISGQGVQLSYIQLDAKVTGTCHNLDKQGVKAGSHVAYWGDNRLEAIQLLLACARLGAVFVPLSTRFPSDQIEQLLADLDISFIYQPEDEILFSGVKSLSLIEREGERLWRFDASKPATMVLTSGSSGSPKAAVHNTLNHMAAAEGSFDQTPLSVDNRWLLSLPIYHIGGMAILYRCLISGATVVLPEKKDAQLCLKSQQITHISMVATQVQRLIKLDDVEDQLASVKVILLGGGAIPPQLATELAPFNLTTLTSYGMTEMGSQICTGPANERGLAGFPLAGRQIRINDDGIIELRGESRFLGYYRNGQLEQPFDSNGWFNSKDRGQWVDEQLKIIGRADNMFISGGENVQPEAIEAVISRCEGVEQVMVVAIADEEFGQLPIAIIDGDYDQAMVDKRLNKKLPRFMRPRTYLSWPDDAQGAGIKVSRKKMQQYALTKLA